MHGLVNRITVALILMGALWRAQTVLWPAVVPLAELPKIGSLDPIGDDSLGKLGVTQVAFQRFDPGAVVLMRCGPDSQPGVAEVDDNGNGVVDDVTELGATRSDDICVVQSAVDSHDTPEGPPTLVLQRGAFIPATWAQFKSDPRSTRAIVMGKSSTGDSWSFLVEME